MSPLRGGQPGLQRGGLAEVAAQLDDAQPRLGRDQAPASVKRPVGAAVVHEHELEAIARLERARRLRRGGPTNSDSVAASLYIGATMLTSVPRSSCLRPDHGPADAVAMVQPDVDEPVPGKHVLASSRV